MIERLEHKNNGLYCRLVKAEHEIFMEAETGYDFEGIFHGENDVKAQTMQACENIMKLLTVHNIDKKSLCKISIYVKNAEDSRVAMEVVASQFGDVQPAMSCISVDLEEEIMLVKLDVELSA